MTRLDPILMGDKWYIQADTTEMGLVLLLDQNSDLTIPQQFDSIEDARKYIKEIKTPLYNIKDKYNEMSSKWDKEGDMYAQGYADGIDFAIYKASEEYPCLDKDVWGEEQ